MRIEEHDRCPTGARGRALGALGTHLVPNGRALGANGAHSVPMGALLRGVLCSYAF